MEIELLKNKIHERLVKGHLILHMVFSIERAYFVGLKVLFLVELGLEGQGHKKLIHRAIHSVIYIYLLNTASVWP